MKTDTEIRRDVENELQWDPMLDATGIGVNVKEGVVTLVGNVTHYADRHVAEQVAKRVCGVRAIANDIEVKIPKPGERSDTDIANAAANALKWNVSVSAFGIKAVVQHGWVTLSGQVAYGYQKSVAESVVRYLFGVKGIANEIIIKPHVEMADVKSKIAEAFKRQASFDAQDIDIKLDHNQVTLKGYVHSWREKDDASRAAWSAPGVVKVENQLQVQY